MLRRLTTLAAGLALALSAPAAALVAAQASGSFRPPAGSSFNPPNAPYQPEIARGWYGHRRSDGRFIRIRPIPSK